MKKRSIITVEVDNQGRFILPAELGKRYGFTAGAKVRLDENETDFRLSRTSENLSRVYIEPTNLCNLDCVTCMRNVWDEAPGQMRADIFNRILEGVREFKPIPSVFFGGFGEPLTHPDICEMVTQVHQNGAVVELITNGILLTPDMSRRLIAAGLDRLWVSLDGATPESYADVRLGAALPQVIANLRHFKELRGSLSAAKPRLGIAFVAMKRNIGDLPELIRLGTSLGADQFSISNVLPHTPQLREEMLYLRSFYEGDLHASEWSPLITLPRLDIDIDSLTGDILLQVLQNRHSLSINRQKFNAENTCPFAEKASLSVRWDGAVSPCLPLMHAHESYLDNHVRKSHAFSVGSLQEHSLAEIWDNPSYRSLRERLLQFDFSPCILCNSCEMADANEEDCFGNTLPTCGGCLWAQGFIQCP
jgi:MoaA/NifB/PqqE/SkfB family radical SAM enzyme